MRAAFPGLPKPETTRPPAHLPKENPMPTEVRRNRRSQIVAWIALILFAAGFFYHPVGMWTGTILGAWFVGTQRPVRGFAWMLAFTLVPSLLWNLRHLPLTGPVPALEYLGWMLLAAVLGVLPFTFHRLVSPRMNGLLSTLPLPLAGVALQMLQPPSPIGAAPESGLHSFLVLWLAAVVVWMWNLEFRWKKIRVGAGIFAALFLVAGAVYLQRDIVRGLFPANPPPGETFAWTCLAGCCALGVYALLHPFQHQPWASRTATVARLKSPFTGDPLHVVEERGRETLVSASGERFPVRNGIPTFLTPQDLTGDNGKYNHLYETIGGFYDDTQRFFCAFRGVDLDKYFDIYMSLLNVKTGDAVLETSVGTGLNFKYLPRGVKLSGLDLSLEMLANCQNNMRRWQMEADLYAGNAESLPFADSSFDVVFTCGGFNFFSDRSKALREMIRVAKPGGHLMVEDETEEYVKSTYERIPYTSSFYGDRQQAVTVPIDLVPPEMEDIHVEMLKEGKFYAITFRKPLNA
jgi:ubiquinone/menaquinone biosynthesis C-methylase UbiE